MKSKKQITIPDHTGERETHLLAFVWNCGFFSRDVSYDVECLTPDELAERINDESFAHTEDYVRFINVCPDLLYPDRK